MSPVKLVLSSLTLICMTAPRLAAACIPLIPGQIVKGASSILTPPCYAIEVTKEHPVRIALEQPEDLAIRVSGGDQEYVVDGFEFGLETLTLAQPGFYTITVVPVESASAKGPYFTVTSVSVSPETAAIWRDAEELSSLSKKAGDPRQIDKSLQLWKSIGDSSSIARTHLKAGHFVLPGNPEGARAIYEEALALCEPRNDFRCIAEAANNSGVAAQRLADFDSAIARLGQAAKAWRHLAHPAEEGITTGNIGVLYQRIGAYAEALESLEGAELVLRSGDPLAHASVTNSLGVCYLDLAESDKARSYFEAAIAESAMFANATQRPRFQANLAEAYLSGGDPTQARTILTTALEKAEKQPQRSLLGYVLNLLGQSEFQLGKLSQAHEHITRALTIHQDSGDRRGQANDLHYLALIAQASHQFDPARESLTKAIQLRRDSGLRTDLAESVYALANLELQTGNLNRARDLGEESLKLIESLRTQVPSAALRAGFYSRQRRVFDLMVEIAMAQGVSSPAAQGLLAAERGRGRALLDLLAEGNIVSRIPPELVAERAATERRIDYVSAQLAAARAPRDAAFRKQLSDLLTQDDAVMAKIHASLADLPFSTPLASVETLQHDGLPPNSALFEFHLGAEHSYLWLVDRENVRVFPLPARAEIERLVRPAEDALGSVAARLQSPRKRAEFQAALKAISETLLEPLRGIALPQRLILALDGVLLQAPFAALTAPGETQPLGLGHDLVQVPSAAFLVIARKPRPTATFPKTALALFDPVFSSEDGRLASSGPGRKPAGDKTLDRLPFGDDIEAIRALTPPARREILSDFNAGRARLDALRLGDFALLHFSTHAVIDDVTPELSHVVLSLVDRNGRPVDGYLRPYRLSQLHLNGSTVVLSACDTALGKQVLGEGLAGFTSSLFEAGASQLVLSLAKVDAKPSARFFADVYSGFLGRKPVAMEHAVTVARQRMAGSKQWSDPYYWASFIVMGQPTGAE